jgi:hypothetical protein
MPRVAFDECEQFIISRGADAGESRSRVGAVAAVDRASEERFNARWQSPTKLGRRRPAWQRLWPGGQSRVHCMVGGP